MSRLKCAAVDSLHSRLEEEAAAWRSMHLGASKADGLLQVRGWEGTIEAVPPGKVLVAATARAGGCRAALASLATGQRLPPCSIPSPCPCLLAATAAAPACPAPRFLRQHCSGWTLSSTARCRSCSTSGRSRRGGELLGCRWVRAAACGAGRGSRGRQVSFRGPLVNGGVLSRRSRPPPLPGRLNSWQSWWAACRRWWHCWQPSASCCSTARRSPCRLAPAVPRTASCPGW